jgi:hypothetical protein
MSSCVFKLNELAGTLVTAFTGDDELLVLLAANITAEVVTDEEELCDCASGWIVRGVVACCNAVSAPNTLSVSIHMGEGGSGGDEAAVAELNGRLSAMLVAVAEASCAARMWLNGSNELPVPPLSAERSTGSVAASGLDTP